MMRSRSRSPSKSTMAPSASSSRPASRMSTSRPPSRADGYRNSVVQPRDDVGPSSSRAPESITRAEFWDVVMEDETEEGNAILPYLGNLITDQSGLSEDAEADIAGEAAGIPRSGSSGSIQAISSRMILSSSDPSSPAGVDPGNPAKFEAQIRELIETERSYVRRLDALYNRYAKPLRQKARNREGAIIPLYEAQRLFGNVGELLGANTAFLRELDELMEADSSMETLKSHIGRVFYKHMACFGCYNDYFGNFEKAKHIEQSMTRNNKLFRDFSDAMKMTSPNLGNVSIRELIMEPVQRIPRYKMLLDGLIKSMPSAYLHQKARLEDAVALCGRIASCEIDEKTQRAAVLWSFGRNIHGFPASLFSIHRKFIDAIDVEDFPVENYAVPSAMFSPTSAAASSRSIHCTLFLFDDTLLVAKRSNPSSSGRYMLSLDDLNRLADEMKTFTERSSNAVQYSKKAELGFRGVSDIMDVQAVDLGGSDLQLYFKRPPSHIQHDKWTGRPLRQYVTLPDSQISTPARLEKMRFLENLWRAQALFKTKEARSQVRTTTVAALCPSSGTESPSLEEAEPRRIVYWNVYESRSKWAAEPHKSNVALQVDLSQGADALPLSAEGLAPQASLRVLTVDQEYAECSYSVMTRDRPLDDDVYVLSMSDLGSRIRRLQESTSQHDEQAALHNFRPGGSPTTPTSHRGRMVAGLEQLSRQLFTPGSLRSADVFGTPRRKGSILSKSSVATSFTSDLFASTGRSVSTAATSVNSRDMLSSAAGDVGYKPGSGIGSANDTPTASSPRRSRAQSAGPEESLSRPIGTTSASARPASQLIYKSAITIVDPHPTKSQSVDSPSQALSPRTMVSSRPTGPRAIGASPSSMTVSAATMTTSRKRLAPRPDPSTIPYTPTRRVTSSKRIAPEDDSPSPSQRASKRTAPPSPPQEKPMPLLPRDANLNGNGSGVNGRTSPTKLVERSTSGIKARVRRNLSRMDDMDKEAAGRLVELADELGELHGAATQLESPLLGELVQRLEAWLGEASQRGADVRATLDRVAGDVEGLLKKIEEVEADKSRVEKSAVVSTTEIESLEKEATEAKVLKVRCEALQRKCELLATLESDGRLENGELHKAFNEELDRMYEDAHLSTNDEVILALRTEVRTSKAQRNEAEAKSRDLERKLRLQSGELEAYKKTLAENGLL